MRGKAASNNGVKSARNKFFYSEDDGLLVSVRIGDYKYVFAEQRSQGTLEVWAEPFMVLRLQKIYNLFQDPFERADITSNTYWDWNLNHVGSAYGMMELVYEFAATFKEFPSRSFPPSFNPATVLEQTLHNIKAVRALHELKEERCWRLLQQRAELRRNNSRIAPLCAISVSSVSLWLTNSQQEFTAEAQRTLRLHREV